MSANLFHHFPQYLKQQNVSHADYREKQQFSPRDICSQEKNMKE